MPHHCCLRVTRWPIRDAADPHEPDDRPAAAAAAAVRVCQFADADRGPSDRIGQAAKSADNKKIASSDQADTGSLDIPVDIQGVMYIFNPPDREKLAPGAAAPVS